MTGAGLAPVMQLHQEDWLVSTQFHRFVKDESGATAIEYALIVPLLAIAIIASLQAVSGELQGVFGTVSSELAKAKAMGAP
jgi:pilus assembly protein Flp/PilA